MKFLKTLKQFVSPGGIEGYFAAKYAEMAKNTPFIYHKSSNSKEKSFLVRDRYLCVG